MIINPYRFAAAAPTPEILWWKCNEGTGTAIAATVGPGGTLSGTWVTGAGGTGSALSFNGTNNYAYSGTVTHNTNVITLTFWLKPTALSGQPVIIQSDGGYTNPNTYVVDLTSTPLIRIISNGTTGYRISTFPSPGTGSWVNVAAIINNSTASGALTMYYDGVIQAETNTTDTKTGTSNFTTAGNAIASNAFASFFYNGAIDDFRIYNRALSAAEISAIYLEPQ